MRASNVYWKELSCEKKNFIVDHFGLPIGAHHNKAFWRAPFECQDPNLASFSSEFEFFIQSLSQFFFKLPENKELRLVYFPSSFLRIEAGWYLFVCEFQYFYQKNCTQRIIDHLSFYNEFKKLFSEHGIPLVAVISYCGTISRFDEATYLPQSPRIQKNDDVCCSSMLSWSLVALAIYCAGSLAGSL